MPPEVRLPLLKQVRHTSTIPEFSNGLLMADISFLEMIPRLPASSELPHEDVPSGTAPQGPADLRGSVAVPRRGRADREGPIRQVVAVFLRPPPPRPMIHCQMLAHPPRPCEGPLNAPPHTPLPLKAIDMAWNLSSAWHPSKPAMNHGFAICAPIPIAVITLTVTAAVADRAFVQHTDPRCFRAVSPRHRRPRLPEQAKSGRHGGELVPC